jgi:hypothetical protein
MKIVVPATHKFAALAANVKLIAPAAARTSKSFWHFNTKSF